MNPKHTKNTKFLVVYFGILFSLMAAEGCRKTCRWMRFFCCFGRRSSYDFQLLIPDDEGNDGGQYSYEEDPNGPKSTSSSSQKKTSSKLSSQNSSKKIVKIKNSQKTTRETMGEKICIKIPKNNSLDSQDPAQDTPIIHYTHEGNSESSGSGAATPLGGAGNLDKSYTGDLTEALYLEKKRRLSQQSAPSRPSINSMDSYDISDENGFYMHMKENENVNTFFTN